MLLGQRYHLLYLQLCFLLSQCLHTFLLHFFYNFYLFLFELRFFNFHFGSKLLLFDFQLVLFLLVQINQFLGQCILVLLFNTDYQVFILISGLTLLSL